MESAKTEQNSHHAWAVRIWKVLCEFRTTLAQHKVLCENFAQAWSSCLPKARSSSFQLQIVHGLKRWILDFLRFEMVYIACRKWTSGSAPKVRKKTAVAVLFASLHFACFSSLLLFASLLYLACLNDPKGCQNTKTIHKYVRSHC